MLRRRPPPEIVARVAEIVRVLGAADAARALDLGRATVERLARGDRVMRGSIAIAERSLGEIARGRR